MACLITFYSEKVEAETLALPPGILANLLRTLELIEEFGPELGRPHTAPLGKGLFEIRAKGKEGIARSVFCTLKGSEIVILLTAVKKANALPKRQMDMARKRMKEVQRGD
ncbi:MAG: type II toxin-antitoxin system RelE/ParE family toxin [Pseudomonadota bacterium]